MADDRLQGPFAPLASSQFKESNLQQQLELVTREKEWLSKELATQQAEFAEYRTTKLATITRLQTELDMQTEAARAAREAADRTAAELATLRQTHEQTAAQLAKVQDELAVSREQFLHEMDAQKRVVAGYEGLVKDTKAQAEQAEGTLLEREREREGEKCSEPTWGLTTGILKEMRLCALLL